MYICLISQGDNFGSCSFSLQYAALYSNDICRCIRSYYGLAICALVSSGILILDPRRHSSEITLQFLSSHRLMSLCWLLYDTPVISFTSAAVCHRLSILSREPNRSHMTLRYSSRVNMRLRMMIG
jgi:hypothetical protein